MYDLNKVKIERYIANENDISPDEGYKRYKLIESGISPRLIPGKFKDQVVIIDSDKYTEEAHITEEAEYFGDEDIDMLLVGQGSTYGSLKEAINLLNNKGIKTGALSFGDIYPLPQKKLKK